MLITQQGTVSQTHDFGCFVSVCVRSVSNSFYPTAKFSNPISKTEPQKVYINKSLKCKPRNCDKWKPWAPKKEFRSTAPPSLQTLHSCQKKKSNWLTNQTHTDTQDMQHSYLGEPSVLFESERIPRVNSIRRRRKESMKNACVHFCPRDLPFAIVIVELNPTTPHCLSNKKEADHQISSSFKDFLSFFFNMQSYELLYWPGCGHLRPSLLLRKWKMLLIRMTQDQDNAMFGSVTML